jgi:flavodoxin
MVNLDGPWGSGKSTVVNFIEASLRARKERWVTVDFSAWRSQRIKPAWWGVVCQLARQTPSQLPLHRRMLFQMHWGWWKIRNDFAAYALVALLFGLAGLFGLVVPNLRPEAVAGQLWLAWLVEQSTTTQGWFKDPATVIATMTSILGAAGLARGIFFGSDSTAKAVEALSSDPYRHVMRLFERLVRSAGRPILIVIDDIDRCSEDYVVDLLEDIQTMLREAPVSYLVVGDRSWITSSFAKRYGEFKEQLEEPGRPIGYQFIEKVFQFSARVPALSDDVVRQFWSGLINKKLDKEGFNKRLRQFNDTANASIANARSETEMQNAIENASDPVLKRAIAARAAVRVASQDFSKELESRFTRYAHLLDRNPRSIKRLINRLGINQAVMLLSQRRINPGALARWTIIEMRWPQVAEALIAKPDLLDLTQGEERNGCIVAEMLKEPEFLRVVSANAALDSDDEADDVLTAQRLSEIVGGPQLAQVS